MKTQPKIEYIVSPKKDGTDFQDKALRLLDEVGFVVVEGLFSQSICNQAFEELQKAHSKIVAKYSENTLAERKEYPMVRLPFEFSPLFYEFLESDVIEALVNQFVSPDAILRSFSGQFVFSNIQKDEKLDVYTWFHQNFRHIENCPGQFLDLFIPLSDLGQDKGAILAVPGSHKWKHRPEFSELESQTITITMSGGAVLFIDGMLWHCENANTSKEDLGAIAMQFCPPIIKQHIDYPRALGKREFEKMSERCRRYLGWYARIPSSLDEYYEPLEERTYHFSKYSSE